MSNEMNLKDGVSKYRDNRGSFRSSMPRWTDMGNVNDGYGGYEYLDPWGQMGLKYAPQYYHNEPVRRHARSSENSSSGDDTDSNMLNEKPIKGRLQGRKIALIVIVAGLVAIAAAITVILVLSLKPAESQPNKFRVVTMSVSVAETFKSEYKNQSSLEYKLFAGNFTSAMDEIFQANNTKGYEGTQIVELKNGSVVVIFTVVIEFKQSEGPPGEEVIKAVITGQKTYVNDSNSVVIKNFIILKASLLIVKTEELASNPISTTAEPMTTSTTATKATTTTSITSPPSPGPNNFSVATVNLAVDDTFKPEYNNTSSVEYQTFAADFTIAMDKIFNTTEGYKGSQIKELKNGSVIVIFIIVIEVKQNVKPLGEDELKALIIGQEKDANDNTTVVIGRLRILTTNVSVVAIDKVVANPIWPTANSTTTKTSTSTTTFQPAAFTTVQANITTSTIPTSNPHPNASTTTSTIAIITTPTTTSTTLHPSTTTTSTSTSTTTATTTRTSPGTSEPIAISTTLLTSATASIPTATPPASSSALESNMTTTIPLTSSTTSMSATSIATTQTSLSPSTISTSTSTTTSTSPTANTTSTNTPELKANSTTLYSSTSTSMPTTTGTTSPKTIEQITTTSTSTSPATPTLATARSTSLKSPEPNATNTIISTSLTISTPTTISTSLKNAHEPNATTTTSTNMTKTTTTLTTSTKIPELSTTSFNPSTISTTLSNTPSSILTITTASNTTTAANATSSISSTKLSEPSTASTTTPASTTSSKSTTISTTSPKPPETNVTTAATLTSTTMSIISTNNTASPRTSEANMTSTTASTTTISLKPTTNNTTLSNTTTPIMTTKTAPTTKIAANVTTPSISSTKPPEPNMTSVTTPISTNSYKTTTPIPTTSLNSTRISTTSAKSPESNTITSASINTSSIITNSTNTATPIVATTTQASTTSANVTSSISSIKSLEPSKTSTPTLTPTTNLWPTTISNTSTFLEPNTTTGTTSTSTAMSNITTYITTSPKPTEANMTSTAKSTTTISLKPTTNGTMLSNTPTPIMTTTTALKSTSATYVTTTSSSSTKPPEPNITITTTPTSTTSLIPTTISNITPKSPEPNTTSATTSTSTASAIISTYSIPSPKPTEANMTSITTAIPTTILNPITTNISLTKITELSTTVALMSTTTTILMPSTTSAILPSTPEQNATNATTSTSTYRTNPSSSAPTTMATTNISKASTVPTNSTMGPSKISSTTIATTTTTTTGVAFNMKHYTAVVGVPLQLICTVTGWNGNLSISRLSRSNQQEVKVANFVNNETVKILNGFAVNRTLSGYNVIVSIFILNASCEDEGSYYCTSGAVSDNATVKRERVKPILQLPEIMIRDNYHSDKYPFVCEADIENPGEILIAEVNKNATFYFYEGYNERRVNITTYCGNKQRFTFYINGKFTPDWDNAKIRCLVINNMTNGDTGIRLVSEESTIRLVPADICSGVADGSNITHPYSACELFLKCQSGVPVLGECQQGQCFYDNIGMCRAPKCPFLYCRDTEVNIGDRASITCEILFCNNSFSLSIKHYEDILFSNVNISSNISLKSDNKDIQISVSRGAAAVTLTLNKTNCNHTGEYTFDLDMESFIDRARLELKVPPKIPTLHLPQSIVAYTETAISCTGEQGMPQQDMYIEVMFNSSNFSKYDKTLIKRNSQNCSNMGTLVMYFLVEDMWNGARIRCVIGDNISSRLESDVHEISIIYTGVRFSSTKFSGLMNGTVQMHCIVNGVFNGDNIIISRSNSGILAEEFLSIITVGNSTGSNFTGIQISTTNFSVNEMIVHIQIESLQCHDGGTYYCKTGNRTAITTLEIWRKPDKPKLKLPVDVTSNGYNQKGDPFVCEGNVGYPEGDLTVLFNKDGNFKEAQPFSATKTTGNVTECGRVNKFEFYLNIFTSDLHNSTVRCVATNNKTLSNASAPFDDKVLLLVPGNTCYGATEGLLLPYPYPFYDCGKYIYCYGNRTFVKDGACKDEECYYTDIKRCEQEKTTTTTKPTTTTQVACPSVACSGADPVINSAATITCALILCGDEFDLAIELDSNVHFRETMRGNRTASFLSNALLNLVVKDKTAELRIEFQNILCNQSGAYNVSIYGGNVSSVAAIRVRVNPEKPNITAPSKIYKNQKAIISCIGQLGIPNASLFWQLMLPGGNFESYSVSGSPDISKRDCSVIGNWTISIYPEQSWNGGGIRCVTKTQGYPSMEIYSYAITLTLEEPDIYFLPSTSSGYIGSSHSITCIARDMTNIMSVIIERQTTSGLHEVASLAIDGTRATNFIGIKIRNTSMINSTAATVYTDFNSLTCADKGDYFCTIGAFSSRGNLSVLRKPEMPQMVTFPTSGILENTSSGTINCTGEVGYPARKIVFESNKGGNNTFAPVPFSLTSIQIEGNCSTTYSATFSYTFGMDWNSTVIRCKIYTGNVLDDTVTSLYVDRKVLIIPGNICKTSNAIYVPHPYACGKYVWCEDRIYLQECAQTLCHLTVPDNSTACGYTCNGCIDSF